MKNVGPGLGRFLFIGVSQTSAYCDKVCFTVVRAFLQTLSINRYVIYILEYPKVYYNISKHLFQFRAQK